MTRRDPAYGFRDMLTHAQEAVALVQGKQRIDVDNDRLLNLALVRLLEIIGEAANRIPRESQLEQPEIPWMQIIGLRNRLIHGYDAVDFDILWQIVTEDLPPLIATLAEIVSPEGIN
jgi:uncharacterized protein with HEPN domain